MTTQEDEFQSGDLVRLKSGGPDMAVEDIDTKGEVYRCWWFDGNRLRKKWIPAQLLVKAIGLPKNLATYSWGKVALEASGWNQALRKLITYAKKNVEPGATEEETIRRALDWLKPETLVSVPHLDASPYTGKLPPEYQDREEPVLVSGPGCEQKPCDSA